MLNIRFYPKLARCNNMQPTLYNIHVTHASNVYTTSTSYQSVHNQLRAYFCLSYTEWHRKKVDCHGVCEHSVCKLLLNNGFIIVERRLPRIGYGDDKE